MRSKALRWFWITSGLLALALGAIGIVLPVLPTVPFVLLAAYCFSRGSQRWENWLLNQPTLGPMVRDWREHRAVPLRAKQLATVMMTISSALSWWFLPTNIGWIPAATCTLVAIYLWRLPTRSAPTRQPSTEP
ncbi:YbaN family protein [Arenimonas oryziterrae]|uniref:Inner membrane protein n=1 Tax=Arenimonas oryziterrae DSM 21050 = YC6267 TaxID=1121015 RepID=A0A091B2A0_9GAMM|nr:YbaN family protein [Arenimonas oryziterrae]KFN44999.1 hypothetical protein N789_02980 [Arenimonas oryziterrae DSM 21050 = YC6267]